MTPAQIIIGLGVFLVILAIIAIIKGFARRIFSAILTFIIIGLAAYANINDIKTPQALLLDLSDKVVQSQKDKVVNKAKDSVNTVKDQATGQAPQAETPSNNVDDYTETTSDHNEHFVTRLNGTETSTTDENGNPIGSAKYGATIILGDLDSLGRATFAHVLVSDAQEPGQNGESRPTRIENDPAGWAQFKVNGNYTNDRTHLAGYQFTGVNSDIRNLVTATAYLNRGVHNSGTNKNNPDSMLYYEERLDSWLATHPNYKLDLYVKPLYEGDGKTAKQIYMQWVGVDENGDTIAINIGGNSIQPNGDYYVVVLDNATPELNIDYLTGQVTSK